MPIAPPAFAYQPSLRPSLPTVYGPVEFREFRDRFVTIDRLLHEGAIENDFVKFALAENADALVGASAKDIARFARTSALALRCNIARLITGSCFRDFAVRASESSLLQWFLGIGEVDRVKVPSKSTLERFSKWVSEEVLTQFHLKLMAQAAAPATAGQAQPLNLAEPIDIADIFLDSTCLKAPIHFPVDWVLLRDATRTLMKATTLIRREGLKHRMPQEPLQFLGDMNKLAMAMSANRRKPDSKKQRKRTLRQMKTLQKKVARHAQAHRDLLVERREETGLSEKQAQAIIGRIDNIMTQLPDAIQQAHERIIGERPVANASKILSLYEKEVDVIVRGKAGAEVEFGNKLWIAETRQGLIADWALLEQSEADSNLVLPCVKRMREKGGLAVQGTWGDRGLFSQSNEEALAKLGVKSGLCPRDPEELQRRLEAGDGFREGLTRRSGVEARIAIFKNVFAGNPCQAKGIAARKLAVGWAVIAHNLWVIARIKLGQERQADEDAQAA